jgi:hypothetical protein
MKRTPCLLIALALLWPLPVFAQGDVPEDPVTDDPNDKPGNPNPEEPKGDTGPQRYTRYDYPMELTLRPLTLAAGQVEGTLRLDFQLDDLKQLAPVLSARYGVTVDLEAGLTYAPVSVYMAPVSGQSATEVGKAVAPGVRYTILVDKLAAEVKLPMYFGSDFGMGVSVGLPFLLPATKGLVFFGGQDLLVVKLMGFIPSAEQPSLNAAELIRINVNGLKARAADLNVNLGVAYQAKPNLVLVGEMGYHLPDMDTNDTAISAYGTVMWSRDRALDAGLRIGLDSLDTPESTHIWLFVTYRR